MNEILGHMAYQICNAPINLFPFPHIYIHEVFPWDFYWEMLDQLPDEGDYSTGSSNYNGRKFADPSKVDLLSVLNDREFRHIASLPFKKYIQARFPSGFEYKTDLRLVRDRQNYAIGPHTDAPWKILSYLFYLPSDNSLREHGTSIYLPNDPSFRCPGGPHHKFKDFTKIATAPFVPNSMLAFFKTDFSFHGVEPITIQCQRDVLLWNLYESAAQNGRPTS